MDEDNKRLRIQNAIENQRRQWRFQSLHIFETRRAADFKRRIKTADRAETLMDMQTQYCPRDEDTMNSFYQSTISTREEQSKLQEMVQKRLDHVSKIERHRFNVMERTNEFRSTLRNNQFLYTKTHENPRNMLWATKPLTSAG